MLPNNEQDVNTQQEPVKSEPVSTDPVEMAKKIMEIETNLSQGISAIAEVLIVIAQGKSDLERIKSLTKDRLSSLINEQNTLQ